MTGKGRRYSAEFKAKVALAALLGTDSKRSHQALANRAPMAGWRAGTTGPLGPKAVDMMLRLDNAVALSTGPQPQQPQLKTA